MIGSSPMRLLEWFTWTQTLDWPAWIQATGALAALSVAVWVQLEQRRLLRRQEAAAAVSHGMFSRHQREADERG
jgi:hypothetical protein